MTSNPAFAKAIADLVRVGVLAPDATPATIEDLVLYGVTDLSGLEDFPALQTIGVSGAEGADYTTLAVPPVLHVLTLEHATISTLDGAIAPELRVAIVRRNRLTSIAALERHSGLQVLDVSGNPLAAEAVALARALQQGGVVLTIDDDEVLDLNRELAAKHPDLVCYGTAPACTLTVTGLARLDLPENVAIRVTAEQVRGLIGDDDAFTSLIDNRWGGNA